MLPVNLLGKCIKERFLYGVVESEPHHFGVAGATTVNRCGSGLNIAVKLQMISKKLHQMEPFIQIQTFKNI
jgi:hypothetical protein